MTNASVKYVLQNKKSVAITVILEPWADEISVPPDKTLEIVAGTGPIETIIDEKYVTVELSSHVTVSLDGKIVFQRL